MLVSKVIESTKKLILNVLSEMLKFTQVESYKSSLPTIFNPKKEP